MCSRPKDLHPLVEAARNVGITGIPDSVRRQIEAEAEREGLDPLTSEHWAVIVYVLDTYRLTRQSPALVRVGRACGLGLRQLDRLFPSGVVVTVFRLAHLDRPPDLPPSMAWYMWN